MGSVSPIVKEIRQRAVELSAGYGHDLRKYAEHLRVLEKKYEERVVSQITVIKGKPRSGDGT